MRFFMFGNLVGNAARSVRIFQFKEVLRRENQGLKVYPVDGSDVFSITGTYFYFFLSMMPGLIFKKMPEAGILFCYNSSCAQ
jgi:hypothetical protein